MFLIIFLGNSWSCVWKLNKVEHNIVVVVTVVEAVGQLGRLFDC